MLDFSNNFDILNSLVRSADFLCQSAPLVCAGEQTALLTNRRTRGFLLEEKMPRGVFIRTLAYRKKMSLAHKNKPNSGQFKKGYRPWHTGKGKHCWCKECERIYNKFYIICYRNEHREELQKKWRIKEEDFVPQEGRNRQGRFVKKHCLGMTGKKHLETTKEKMSKKQKGIPNFKLRGVLSHLWRGGVTPLRHQIRYSLENKIWRETVFKRDNYICQECFKKSSEIHPHHKIPLLIIFNNFLKHYSQFSPIDDKETLIRLATTYEPFWDITNGITLCGDCHRKTENYGKKVFNNSIKEQGL